MPARRRLRKLALWCGIAIPVLAAVYWGAYYRMVTPVNLIISTTSLPLSSGDRATGTVTPDNSLSVMADRFFLQRNACYALPWPLPSHLNDDWLQVQLHRFFRPAHELDRRLRPELWDGGPFGPGTLNTPRD